MSGYNVTNPPNFVVQPVPLAPEWLPGMMMPYAGSVPPTGWLLCQGQSLLRSQYLALFEVIGTTYGAADADHFSLPDCRGNVIVGLSAAPYAGFLGQTGGAAEVTLNVTQIPAHQHGGTTDPAGLHSHTHNANGGTNIGGAGPGLAFSNGASTYAGATDSSPGEPNLFSQVSALSIDNNGTHQHSFTTQNTGGGQPHNNLQPYITLNYMIRFL